MKTQLLNSFGTISYIRQLGSILLLCLLILACSEDGVEFQETGTITGTVISEDSQQALANVEISTSPASSTVFTNDNGDFTINDVLVDSYAVQADLSGFEVGFESVTVTADNISNVAFQLEPAALDNLAPTTPELISPEDGADNIDIQVDLEWFSMDPEGEELDFTIELRNGTTSEIETFEVVGDSTLTVTGLNLSTTYFWQVIATDNINDPISSTLSQFTTLESPTNPILFVREENDNNVIFSGNIVDGVDVDANVLQLTDASTNSFNPHKNSDANRIAFMRTVAGDSQLFTMDLAGEDVQQLTSSIPVSGFRPEEIDFDWFNSGAQLLYPNFNRLIAINNDGSGTSIVYETPDDSLISEVVVPDFDNDLVVIKTNNLEGYETRIVLIRLSTQTEEAVILENEDGASGGIDITASASDILYFRDVTGNQNDDYRIFESRPFLYNIANGTTTMVETDVSTGMNVLDTSFLPTEAGMIFTRVGNTNAAVPSVATRSFSTTAMLDDEIFTEAFMPDFSN